MTCPASHRCVSCSASSSRSAPASCGQPRLVPLLAVGRLVQGQVDLLQDHVVGDVPAAQVLHGPGLLVVGPQVVRAVEVHDRAVPVVPVSLVVPVDPMIRSVPGAVPLVVAQRVARAVGTVGLANGPALGLLAGQGVGAAQVVHVAHGEGPLVVGQQVVLAILPVAHLAQPLHRRALQVV